MIDRELVLDLWADGRPIEEIAAAVGTLYNTTIIDIAAQARKRGDPRARKRARHDWAVGIGKAMRRRRLAKIPADPIQMAACIAAYDGPITTLPSAYHAGHTPYCIKWLGA